MMNKQELIDDAIEFFEGKFPYNFDQIIIISTQDNTFWRSGRYERFTGDSNIFSVVMGNSTTWEVVCDMGEFEKRARELGWVNGYKYGVEYPTNREKPDLDDDVKVEVYNTYCKEWMKGYVRLWAWDSESIIKFRICDDRYKPKPEPLGDSEQLEGKRYKPKVGEICEIKMELREGGHEWVVVRFMGEFESFVWVYSDNTSDIIMPSFLDFRPIKTERDKFIDFCISSISEFKSANQVFGELYDSGKFMLKE